MEDNLFHVARGFVPRKALRPIKGRATTDQRGSVLLLSLLVLSSVLLTTAGVVDLTLRTLGSTRVADQGIVAYYAAESSLEQALYQIRRDGLDPASLDLSGTLANGSSWTRRVSSPLAIFATLSDTHWTPLDLYDPTDVDVASGVSSVVIKWDGPASSFIKIDYVILPAAGSPVWADNATHLRLAWNENGVTVSLDPDRAYRMRISSEAGALTGVAITARNSVGAQIPIPFARVNVTATGSFGLARPALRLSMPRNDFVSGLFRNLIWSDCSIVKNKAADCP